MNRKIKIFTGVLVVVFLIGILVYQLYFSSPKLSDFPEVFRENTLIIIGDKASEIEIQAAKEIADYLNMETKNKPLIKKYSEVSDEDRRNNLIVIGTPYSNPMLKEVYAMADVLEVNESFPGEGKGVLEILENPWNEERAVLLVEGWDEWGVKEAWVLLNQYERIKLQSLTTEDFKKLLVSEVSKFVKNYPVLLFKKHVSNWVILNSTEQIPYSKPESPKIAPWIKPKNPEKYANIVKPPMVYINNDGYVVSLYTWTEYGGVLLKWNVTVKSGCLDYVEAWVVDVFVGDCDIESALIGLPESRIVGPGDWVVGDPEVKEVCISLSSIS